MDKGVEALIARKGNAVTGSYYLAECGACGEMFTSERMTGGEAIADTGDYGDCYCPHCDTDDSEIIDCGAVNSAVVEAWNFQQKHIDALIAALEQAQRQNGYLREQSSEWERKAISNFEECSEMSVRIEELESQRKLAFTACNRWRDKCVDAEKRITELEAAPNGMMQLSNELAEMKRKRVELTVWYGAMPESNGKTNWTAILHRKGECLSTGITIDRSEYPDRVRYEADRMSHLIGELTEEPDILAYDANKHSGYTARKEGE